MDDKEKRDTDRGTEGDKNKEKKGQRSLISKAEIEKNVAFVEWKEIQMRQKLLERNVQMKKTNYILSGHNEVKKKAMEDAETNLRLLMKKKKTKSQAFVKFMGSLPKPVSYTHLTLPTKA